MRQFQGLHVVSKDHTPERDPAPEKPHLRDWLSSNRAKRTYALCTCRDCRMARKREVSIHQRFYAACFVLALCLLAVAYAVSIAP